MTEAAIETREIADFARRLNDTGILGAVSHHAFDALATKREIKRPRLRSESTLKAAADAAAETPKLTSYESAVLKEISGTPISCEVLSRRSRMTRSDTRLGLRGLIATGLVRLDGCGYVLASAKPTPGLTRLDVVENDFAILVGSAEERLRAIPAGSVDLVVTSPPYFHERHYGSVPGQIGWEKDKAEYIDRIVSVLALCAEALRENGLIFFNFDDHLRCGRLAGIEHKLFDADRLGAIGLEVHREIIWYKPNGQPNGTDSGLKRTYEKVFVLRKRGASHNWDTFNAREIAKHGGMKRMDDVWVIPTGTVKHAKGHRAPFPPELVRRAMSVALSDKGYCDACGAPWKRVLKRGLSSYKKSGTTAEIKREYRQRTGKAEWGNAAGTKIMASMEHVDWRPTCSHKRKPTKALVLDPFMGSGTTGLVALEYGCSFIGVEINEEYVRNATGLLRAAAANGQTKRLDDVVVAVIAASETRLETKRRTQ